MNQVLIHKISKMVQRTRVGTDPLNTDNTVHHFPEGNSHAHGLSVKLMFFTESWLNLTTSAHRTQAGTAAQWPPRGG